MKLAILSCSPQSYSTRRLREAAVQRGHKVKVLNTLKFAIDLEEGMPDLYFSLRLRGREVFRSEVEIDVDFESLDPVSGDPVRITREFGPYRVDVED